VGAMSLVNKNVNAYSIVAGIPIRKIGKRNQKLLSEMEKNFQSNQSDIT
jgi:serine acetyltransferase